MKKILCVTLLILVIGLDFSFFSDPFSLHVKDEKRINFDYKGNRIVGSLYIPKTNNDTDKVVLFLHGDGASNRTDNDQYIFLMNAFLDKGVAVFSWDKPGVGESEGNWLYFNQKDRAELALEAQKAVKNTVKTEKIGFMGMSQGGWVLSEIALLTDQYDFMICVSGAINWMRQGKYMTEERLKDSGMSEAEIERYNSFFIKSDQYIIDGDYEGYLSHLKGNEYDEKAMSKDRFFFVHKNMFADATEGIYKIASPFLGLFGADDKNVNARESAATYRKIFDELAKDDSEIIVFENASHTMLKQGFRAGEADTMKIMGAVFSGTGIYTDGFLEKLGNWVNGLE